VSKYLGRVIQPRTKRSELTNRNEVELGEANRNEVELGEANTFGNNNDMSKKCIYS
jgi:hypothetical protein